MCVKPVPVEMQLLPPTVIEPEVPRLVPVIVRTVDPLLVNDVGLRLVIVGALYEKNTLSVDERAPTVATTRLLRLWPTGSVHMICVCDRVSTTHVLAPIFAVPVVPKFAPATVT